MTVHYFERKGKCFIIKFHKFCINVNCHRKIRTDAHYIYIRTVANKFIRIYTSIIQIQGVINVIANWSNENRMPLSIETFFILHCGCNNPRYPYVLSGQSIKQCDVCNVWPLYNTICRLWQLVASLVSNYTRSPSCRCHSACFLC